MAHAALGLGGVWVHEHRAAAQAADVEVRQRRALSRLDPESSLGLRLRARLAGEADYRRGDHAAIMAALEEARRRDEPVPLAETLSIAHHCLLGPDHGTERLALAHELLGASARTGRLSDLTMGLLWRTVDLFLQADVTAERSLAELRHVLAAAHHGATGYATSAIDVMLTIRQGRFAAAEELATACAERGSEIGDADATGWYAAQLLAIRWYQGRADELSPMLAGLVSTPSLGIVDRASYAALAVSAAAAGNRRQATCALARLRGRNLADLPRSSSWLVAVYGAVEAANVLGDRQVAAEAYSLLRPYASLPMMASLAIGCFGSTHHALGVAALTVGRMDEAVEHFRQAVRSNRALGHWPAVVVSTHRLGHALARRNASGDWLDAARELAAAESEAAVIGLSLPVIPAVSPDARTGSSPQPLPPDRAVFNRRGRQWQVQLGHRTATVSDCVGIRHLAALAAQPGQEIHATDLVVGVGRSAVNPGAASTSASPQEVLDHRARLEYRRRLAQLTAEIDEHAAMNDLERMTRARAERDWLLAELGAAMGLTGRARRFTDDAERARVAVTKAIYRGLDKVAAADPVIGSELRSRVQTGQRCCLYPQ